MLCPFGVFGGFRAWSSWGFFLFFVLALATRVYLRCTRGALRFLINLLTYQKKKVAQKVDKIKYYIEGSLINVDTF
jgi:hypothetical protein